MSSIKDNLIKYTPRKEQTNALEYFKKVCKEKPDNKFFLFNLPTGSGKSYLALLLSEYYTSELQPGKLVDITTAGKVLQSQYSESFDCIKCYFWRND